MRIRRVLAQGFAGALLFAAGVYCGMCFNDVTRRPKPEYVERCAYPGCRQPAEPLLGGWATHELPSCRRHRMLVMGSATDIQRAKVMSDAGMPQDDIYLCLVALGRLEPVFRRAPSREKAKYLYDVLFSGFRLVVDNWTPSHR